MRKRNRPPKHVREAMAQAGHVHSPSVQASAIRLANKHANRLSIITRKSDTPSPLTKAAERSPFVRAFVPVHGQGQAKPKPKVTPAHKRKFAGEASTYTVDLVTGPGKSRILTRHKAPPQRFVGEHERNHRSDGKRHPEMERAEYMAICERLGLDPVTGRKR